MRALARASRSYTIYDPRNEAIRAFLEAVKDAFEVLLGQYGESVIEIRPYELVLEGEPIYLDRDRERSLAFKLFRDGVRRLTLQPGLSWHELTQLLGVLSMRYVGIHQNPAEDDVVTLLWKAGFQHVQVEAVEGWIPEDEAGGPMNAAVNLPGQQADDDGAERVPVDFDLPAPDLPDLQAPTYKELSAWERSTLVAEDDSTRLADTVRAMVEELLQAAVDPTDPFSVSELLPTLRDVRGVLLTDEHIPVLLRTVRAVEEAASRASENDQRALEDVAENLLGAAALGTVIKSVGSDAQTPAPEVFDMMRELRCDALPVLLDLLDNERGTGTRRILRQLIESYLPARADVVLARYQQRRGSVAADLLRVLANKAPQAASDAITQVAQGEDLELQLEFLALARQLPGGHLRALLVHLLHSNSEEIRLRTLGVILGMRESGAFAAVTKLAEGRSRLTSSDEELEAIGHTLAGLHADQAMALFRQWGKPAGLFGKLVGTGRSLRLIAVAGLRMLPGEEPENILKELSNKGDDTEKTAARKALAMRRRTQTQSTYQAALDALSRYREGGES